MPAKRAVSPLNPTAARAASNDFYGRHPEMVHNGRREPIDPCDPHQAQLRREWVQNYERHGGSVAPVGRGQIAACGAKAKKQFAVTPVASPTQSCKQKPDPRNAAAVRAAPRKKVPNAPPCELVKAVITCEHGRSAGPTGILMVVPSSTASVGDKINGKMTMKGGCGTHPAWSIGGHWTSSGKGAALSFNAAKWMPTFHSIFHLRGVDPHVYRVGTTACSGGPQQWEVRAYPPGGHSGKFDMSAYVEHIADALGYLPLPDDAINKWKKNWFRGSIQYSGAWKENSDWQAYYEMAINGAFDPLFGLSYKGPVYPLTLVPGWLSKWVKAGLFFEVGIAAKFSAGIQGKYWPNTGKSTWTQRVVKGGGAGTGALSLELLLCDQDLVSGAVSAETGLEIEIAGTFGDDPGAVLSVKFPGLKGKATLKAIWGIVEFSREFQLLQERELVHVDLWKGAKSK